MPKLSELLQTAHDPNPAPEDAIPTLKEVSGEATNKMVYLEDLPVSTAQAAADALKVDKANPGVLSLYDVSSAGVQGTVRYAESVINLSVPQRGAAGGLLASSFILGSYSGPAIITGTGFPNGVVSAPVGSKYIDKSASGGITSWSKRVGASNTGWQPDSLTATVPASATATGVAGQTAYDSSYFYVCTATNTWKRTALSSW